MGVAHLAGRAVARMSSGEAKRTLIARALVHDPRALLFDEPSNALDIAAQLQLRAAMRELAQSGIAILLVTHHVSEIIPEIERVILLRDGRIIADGPKDEVLTSEANLGAIWYSVANIATGWLLSHPGMTGITLTVMQTATDSGTIHYNSVVSWPLSLKSTSMLSSKRVSPNFAAIRT